MTLYNKRYIDQKELSDFVYQLKAKTVLALKQWNSNPVHAHNALTHYVLAMLKFATGQRPVIDPFCYREDIQAIYNRCLINDKVVSPRHIYRIAPLCPTAVMQLDRYFSHLNRLGSRLRQSEDSKSIALGRLIEQMLYEKKNDQIPLFFLLDTMSPPVRSIEPGEQEQYWHQLSDIPLNYGRAFLATELVSKGIATDVVETLLNHTDGVRHFFGPRSLRSPMSFVSELLPPINDLINDIGFTPIGPKPVDSKHGTPPKRKKSPINTSDIQFLVNKILGPIQREQDRKARKHKVSRLVDEQIAHLQIKDLKIITLDLIETLEARVLEASDHHNVSSAAARWKLYEILNSWRKKGTSLQGLGHKFKLFVENSPIKKDNFKELAIYDNLKLKFFRHLENKGKENRGGSAQHKPEISELLVSAALCGALVSEDDLLKLSQALPLNAHIEDGIFSVEIDHKRWFPDSLTKAFILGVEKSKNGSSDIATIKGGIKNLLQELGYNKSLKDSLGFLTRIAKAGITYYYPGFIRSALLQERPCKSFPSSAWVRLLRNQRLSENSLEDDSRNKQIEDNDWLPNINPGDNENPLLAKDFLDEVGTLIKIQIEALESSDARSLLPAKRKLAESLLEYQETRKSLSLLESLLCGWTWKLCHHGPIKKNIKLETIKDYFNEIGEPLLALAHYDNFLDLADFEYEEIYFRVLDSNESTDSPIGRLFDFHSYLVDSFLVESPEWGTLFLSAGLGPPKKEIDANLITYNEYLKCLERCEEDTSLPDSHRSQYQMLLLLGYHFQLRFGEAIRLQYRDIQTDQDYRNIWVQITNSIYGTTKSLAGVRQVPLLAKLSNIEIKLISRILTLGELGFEEDELRLLLTSGSARQVIDRGKASRYINSLLRDVSGDPSVRYHHFRHGGFSQLVAAALDSNDPDWQTLQRHTNGALDHNLIEQYLGQFKIKANPLVSIADRAGHATEAISLSSYIHFHDLISKTLLNIGLNDISRNILSYALAESYGTLQQRVNRLPKNFTHKAEYGVRTSKRITIFEPFSEATTSLDKHYADIEVLTPKGNDNKLTPLIIHQILEFFTRRRRQVNQIAIGLSISKEQINEVIELAKAIERESGFHYYNINSFNDLPVGGKKGEQVIRFRQNRQHIRRISHLLNTYERNLSNNRQDLFSLPVKLGLDAWIRCHHNGQLLFVTSSDLSDFIHLLSTIGIEQNVKKTFERPAEEEIATDINQICKDLDITIISNNRVPTPSEKLSKFRKTRGILKIDLPGHIKTNLTLNGLLYILSILAHVSID